MKFPVSVKSVMRHIRSEYSILHFHCAVIIILITILLYLSYSFCAHFINCATGSTLTVHRWRWVVPSLYDWPIFFSRLIITLWKGKLAFQIHAKHTEGASREVRLNPLQLYSQVKIKNGSCGLCRCTVCDCSCNNNNFYSTFRKQGCGEYRRYINTQT